MSRILQLKHHKAMWYNGWTFHVKSMYDTNKIADSGITAVFQVTNVSSRSDKHPRLIKNRYYGYLDDIIEWLQILQDNFVWGQMVSFMDKWMWSWKNFYSTWQWFYHV